MMAFMWPWEASSSITPPLAALSISMHIGWAMVLGAGAVFLLRSTSIKTRISVALLITLLCLLPNDWSPSWWFGLAFQTPSLVLQGLCAAYLYQQFTTQTNTPILATDTTPPAVPRGWPIGLLSVAIIAGWLLALDTFAVFNISLYAIGFTPYAILAALFFACLLQLISARSEHAQRTRHYRDLAAITLIAIVVHLLLRLPTGNMWDALLDPWLWIVAHAMAIFRLLKKMQSRE